MKDRAEMVGLGIGDKLKEGLYAYRKLGEFIATIFIGYVCACSSVMAGISPFGAAFCASVKGEKTLGAAIGSIIGYIVSSRFGGMKYISAVIIISSVKWFLSSGKLFSRNKLYSPIIAFCSMMATSITVTAVYGFAGYDIVLSISESLICGGCAYFFSKTSEIFEKTDSFVDLKQFDASTLIITSIIMVMIFTDITIGKFSVGRVLSILAVLFAAYSGRESMGSVVGIVTGFAISLSMVNDYYVWAMLALGGLVCGVFSNLGRFAMTISFVLTSGGMIFASGDGKSALIYLYEVAFSTVVFMLLPERYVIYIKDIINHKEENLADKGIKSLVMSKIDDSSSALMDIAKTTREVSQRISAMKSGQIEDIYNKTADSVCNKCVNKRLCWQKNYNDTMNSFNNMTEILRSNGKITPLDFTQPLAERCIKADVVAAYVNKFYEDYLSKEGTLRKVSQVRSVVTDQFEGMALMLQGFADDIYSITSFDMDITKKVTAYLQDKALDARMVNCYRDKDSRVTIQVFIPNYKVRRIDREKITEDFSELCDCPLGYPEIFESESTARVTFTEKEVFEVRFSGVQYNCKNGKVCGDSYTTFSDKNGKAHVILSDGMGAGCVAAVDSSMTVSLVKKLIGAGVSYDAALKTVNSALLVKSGEESLATIDIATVDLHNGKAEFFKAGAAPTYVKKGGKTGYIESTSLPVGILNTVSFDKSSTVLNDGDMVVVVSDGTSGMDDEWIRHTIQRFEDDDIDILCNDIAKTAKLKRQSSFDDDITVVVCRLEKATY